MGEYIGLGISLLIAIAGLATAIRALRGNDSEAASNYADAANKVADDNRRLRLLIDVLESQVSNLKFLIVKLESEVRVLSVKNNDLTEVNERLRQKLEDFAAFQEYLDEKGKAP